MTPETLAATAAAAVGAVLFLAIVYDLAGRVRWRRLLRRRTVLVVLDDGKTFRGVLWRRYRDGVILKTAELLNRDGSTVPVDGDLIIEARRIAWLQSPEGIR